MAELHGVTPILSVTSVTASIDYYVDKLGFRKNWDWGNPSTFGCVGRGEIELFFCQGDQGNPGTWVYIHVDDVDALHEEYRQRGAVIRQPPTSLPWGMREMHVEDPDGHRLRFGMSLTQD